MLDHRQVVLSTLRHQPCHLNNLKILFSYSFPFSYKSRMIPRAQAVQWLEEDQMDAREEI
jgi:hypothetical protein